MAIHSPKSRRAGKWLCRPAVWMFLPHLALHADQIVYDDALQNGWQPWGWAALDYANPSAVHSGNNSVSCTITSSWAGMQLYHPDQDSTPDTSVSSPSIHSPTGIRSAP